MKMKKASKGVFQPSAKFTSFVGGCREWCIGGAVSLAYSLCKAGSARPKSRPGMSLIEIAIGVIILALVLIPAMNVISVGSKSVISTRDHTQAVFVAQRLMEKARTYPFKFLDEDHAGLTSEEKQKTLEYEVKNKESENHFLINGIHFYVKNFNIKEVENKLNNQAAKSLALISFDIEFKAQDGKNHALEFHSAIAQQE